MKIAVAGGTGRIGIRVVSRLRGTGHFVVPLSPSTGVNTLTGHGLSDALTGVTVVVDVTDSPSTDEGEARWFFETSSHNLLAAEKIVGVQHHVVLSMLGVQRIDAGYFHAKRAQEARVRASGIPYTIVRGTQFFESTEDIIDAATDGRRVLLAAVPVQPVAADDVAAVLAHLTIGTACNSVVEVAGPDRFGLNDLAQIVLTARRDHREIVPVGHARYFGADIESGDRSLLPDLVLTSTRVANWLDHLRLRSQHAPDWVHDVDDDAHVPVLRRSPTSSTGQGGPLRQVRSKGFAVTPSLPGRVRR
jgi:uncharacterized protein YbjT (DUF2867 family)